MDPSDRWLPPPVPTGAGTPKALPPVPGDGAARPPRVVREPSSSKRLSAPLIGGIVLGLIGLGLAGYYSWWRPREQARKAEVIRLQEEADQKVRLAEERMRESEQRASAERARAESERAEAARKAREELEKISNAAESSRIAAENAARTASASERARQEAESQLQQARSSTFTSGEGSATGSAMSQNDRFPPRAAEVLDFFHRWRAGEDRQNASEIAHFYAPMVDYLEKGPVTREAIVQDKIDYSLRFIESRHTLEGEPAVTAITPNRWQIVHLLRFEARTPEKSYSGRRKVTVTVERTLGRFEIVAEKSEDASATGTPASGSPPLRAGESPPKRPTPPPAAKPPSKGGSFRDLTRKFDRF